MLFPSSPERRHGQRRKALWKGKQAGKSMGFSQIGYNDTGFDAIPRRRCNIPVCITASGGVRPCRKKPYGPSATKKALLGESLVRFRCWNADHALRIKAMNSKGSSSTVVLSMCVSAIFANHHCRRYWLQFAIVEVQASAAEDMVHLEITDMAMPADGTSRVEHAMVENAALAEIFAVEAVREDMPFAAFVLHVQFGQFIIMPYHENAPFGP